MRLPATIGPTPRPGFKRDEEAFAETFYPSALDQSNSIPIDLKPGGEIRNLEIRLRKERVFRVRGKIIGADSEEPLELVLAARDHTGHSFSSRTREGGFEFANVPAGSYWIQVKATQTKFDQRTFSMTSKPQKLFGRTNFPVDVSGKNIEDIVVPLAPGAVIVGKLISTDVNVDKPIRVSFDPFIAFMRPNPDVPVNDDGTFQIASLPPDRFRVSINPIPDSAYVKSVRYNTQEVVDKWVDLTSGSGGAMEIILAPNAAEISGVVRNKDGRPKQAGVYAWIESATGTDEPPQFARAGKDGIFVLHNLPPGEYRIAAFSGDDEEGVKPPESLMTKVTLHEGSREHIDLKFVSQDALDVARAAWPAEPRIVSAFLHRLREDSRKAEMTLGSAGLAARATSILDHQPQPVALHLHPNNPTRLHRPTRDHCGQRLRDTPQNRPLQFTSSVFIARALLQQPLASRRAHFKIERSLSQSILNVPLQAFHLLIDDHGQRHGIQRLVRQHRVNSIHELGRELAPHRVHPDVFDLLLDTLAFPIR